MESSLLRALAVISVGATFGLAACSDSPVTSPESAGSEAYTVASSLATLQVGGTETCRTIDFDGFEHGDAISTVASGFGFNLSIAVTVQGGPESSDVARAYDTDNVDGPDPDLEWDGPNAKCPDCEGQGPVMVISALDFAQDGDSKDGGVIRMTGFAGHGDFFVKSYVGIDHDADDENPLELFADGTFIGTTTEQGDGSVETVTTSQTGFNTMLEFHYGGSGAVDDIEICTTIVNGGEGCTPGYWRNWSIYAPGMQADSWGPTGYLADDLLNTVFTFPASLSGLGANSLHDALTFGGGPGIEGGARILLRAAVASLLNAAHPDVDFPMSTADVISAVDSALASGNRSEMITLGRELDELNNAGCLI